MLGKRGGEGKKGTKEDVILYALSLLFPLSRRLRTVQYSYNFL